MENEGIVKRVRTGRGGHETRRSVECEVLEAAPRGRWLIRKYPGSITAILGIAQADSARLSNQKVFYQLKWQT
jgi:hypothetical protein